MMNHAMTALLAGAGFLAVCAQAPANAATLNTPEGMAVDAAGNLYVANQTGNSVTIYNNSYALKGRITAGLNSPTSVAIGPTGQIFVANYYGGNVTSYTPDLVQAPTLTDPNDTHPVSVFVDPLAELWVLDAAGTAHAYLDNGTPIGSNGAAGATAFTLWNGNIAFWGCPTQPAGTTAFYIVNAGEVVHGGPTTRGGVTTPVARVGGVAVDGAGQQYATDDYNGDVVIVAPNLGSVGVAIKPAFQPYGIAVDQPHGRIFVSGGPFANAVAVYSFKPPYTLLHTIQ